MMTEHEMQQQRREIEERRQHAAWIQQRTGLRNLTMLRRLSRGEPAAAAVIAAIDHRTAVAIRAARQDATPEQIARRLSDLCSVWVGVGLGGRIFCCDIATGERTQHDTIEEAALWCVRTIPARAGLEAA